MVVLSTSLVNSQGTCVTREPRRYIWALDMSSPHLLRDLLREALRE